MARSLRRAQAVARLRHPNLVRLLPLPGGAGLSPVLGNAHRLSDFTLPAGTFKRFDLEQVVRLLLDVLSGLAALHEVVTDGQAFVHGQVSPQHIYIDEHGTARLVPLLNGVKLEDSGYAAPERLASGAVDARADVFSVGVMLWEALAGKRLFPKGLAAYSLDAQREPIQLSADARWAGPLCALAERATAINPAARFGSALELSNALAAASAQQLSRVDTDAWQDEAPTPVFQPRVHLAKLRTSTPPPLVMSITPPVEVATAEEAPRAAIESSVPEPRRRSRGVIVGATLLALGAAAAVLVARSPSSWRRAAAAIPLPAPVAAVLTLPREAPSRAPAAPLAAVPAPLPALASASPTASPSAAASAAPAAAVGALPASSSSAAPPVRAAAPRAAVPANPEPAPLPAKPKAQRLRASDYGI